MAVEPSTGSRLLAIRHGLPWGPGTQGDPSKMSSGDQRKGPSGRHSFAGQPTDPPREDLFLQVTSEMAVLLPGGQAMTSSCWRRSTANMASSQHGRASPLCELQDHRLIFPTSHVSVCRMGVGFPPHTLGEGQRQQMPNLGHGPGNTKKGELNSCNDNDDN